MDYATKDDLLKVRSELMERIDNTRAELFERIDTTRTELLERIEKSETTLLSEFRKWAVPHNARTKVMEISVLGLAERMELVESRLTDLEQK